MGRAFDGRRPYALGLPRGVSGGVRRLERGCPLGRPALQDVSPGTRACLSVPRPGNTAQRRTPLRLRRGAALERPAADVRGGGARAGGAGAGRTGASVGGEAFDIGKQRPAEPPRGLTYQAVQLILPGMQAAPLTDFRRKRAARTRRRILDAGLRVFSKWGYERASMDDIALELEATKGLLYHYFRSNEELLKAVLQEHPLRVGIETVKQGVPAGDVRQ